MSLAALRRMAAQKPKLLAAATLAVLALVIAAGLLLLRAPAVQALETAAPIETPAPSTPGPEAVQLNDSQLAAIEVGTVVAHAFAIEKQAVGSIDFNEDMSVQVFSPYQGRILQTFADVGDQVEQGQPLFTIESPDFIAAEANLIAAAATLDQTSSLLERARRLYAAQGMNQNDFETAVASQHTAEGALQAARHAIAIFGRSASEIDHIMNARQVQTALVVRSPISGQITARNAAPGLLAQPGSAPAPYSVADLSTVWMLAEVVEADSPAMKVGQAITATVPAYPGRQFSGTITRLGATVDPNSRRVTLRSQIKDPQHLLRPGMFASFVVRIADPVTAAAMPLDGVVREGDGTMSVWVVDGDRHRFVRRVVSVGLQQDGFDQILQGLHPGERVAVSGAILLSNMLYGGAS
jgi:cobalt-zinc-cadmium efflux system membrane fusion protein